MPLLENSMRISCNMKLCSPQQTKRDSTQNKRASSLSDTARPMGFQHVRHTLSGVIVLKGGGGCG